MWDRQVREDGDIIHCEQLLERIFRIVSICCDERRGVRELLEERMGIGDVLICHFLKLPMALLPIFTHTE